MTKEQEKIAAFCRHEKWSQITAEITEHVQICLKLRLELGRPTLPVEFSRFSLEPCNSAVPMKSFNFRRYMGRAYTVYYDGTELYSFSYTREPIPDEAAEPTLDRSFERSFYGATAPKPVKLETKTQVYMVDWDRIFLVEEFLEAIKNAIPDLEVELEQKEADAKAESADFTDFLDGSGELLKGQG